MPSYAAAVQTSGLRTGSVAGSEKQSQGHHRRRRSPDHSIDYEARCGQLAGGEHRNSTGWQVQTPEEQPGHLIMARRSRSSRDDSGSLLAAVLITILGTLFCVITTAAVAPESLWLVGSIAAGPAVCLVLITILQRFSRVRGSGLSFFGRASRSFRDDGVREYHPRKATARPTAFSGGNQPITAEEARDLRLTSANTWIPARGRKRRSERSDQQGDHA